MKKLLATAAAITAGLFAPAAASAHHAGLPGSAHYWGVGNSIMQPCGDSRDYSEQSLAAAYNYYLYTDAANRLGTANIGATGDNSTRCIDASRARTYVWFVAHDRRVAVLYWADMINYGVASQINVAWQGAF